MANETASQPAARLLGIMRNLKAQSAKHGGVPGWHVWGKALELEVVNDRTVLAPISKVLSLGEQVFVAGKNRQLSADLHLTWMPTLERVSGITCLSERAEIISGLLDTGFDKALAITAFDLKKPSEETSIDVEELNKIASDIEKLQAKLTKSSLPPVLLAELNRAVAFMREQIVGYRISGIEGLRDAVNLAFATMLLHKDKVESNRNDEYMVGCWTIFKRVRDVIGLAADVLKILPYLPAVPPFLD